MTANSPLRAPGAEGWFSRTTAEREVGEVWLSGNKSVLNPCRETLRYPDLSLITKIPFFITPLTAAVTIPATFSPWIVGKGWRQMGVDFISVTESIDTTLQAEQKHDSCHPYCLRLILRPALLTIRKDPKVVFCQLLQSRMEIDGYSVRQTSGLRIANQRCDRKK